MQISKMLTNKKLLAMAVGLVCASAVGFSSQAQAYGYSGCSTCKVVKYRHHYRSYKPCCTYNNCYRCNSCSYNTCNTCSTRYSCSGCNYGYGGGYYYGGYYY